MLIRSFSTHQPFAEFAVGNAEICELSGAPKEKKITPLELDAEKRRCGVASIRMGLIVRMAGSAGIGSYSSRITHDV